MTQGPIFDPTKPSTILTSQFPSDSQAPAFDPTKPSTPAAPASKEPLPAGAREPGGVVTALLDTLYEGVKVPAEAVGALGKTALDALINPHVAINKVPDALGNVAQAVIPTFEEFPKAMRAIQAGRLDYGLIHTLNSVVPGWKVAQDQLLSWIHRAPTEGPRVASEMFWSIAPFLPKGAAAGKAPTALMRDPNPAMATAIDAARAQGVNIPAGAATGRPILTGAQELAERATMTGGHVGAVEGEALRSQMHSWGTKLADAAHPAPTSELQAGQRVIDEIRKVSSKYTAEAGEAYKVVQKRQAASKPVLRALRGDIDTASMSLVQMPVDLRPIHKALQKLSNHFQGVIDSGGTLSAAQADANLVLKNFINGEDFAPLMTTEEVLGTIKAAARRSAEPKMKAVLGEAIARLDAQIMQRAAQEGIDVQRALSDGRMKTAKKYNAENLLAKDLGVKDIYTAEPARVAERLISAPNDTRSVLVSRLNAIAPESMPELARASLQRILETGASAENGLGRAQTMFDRWHALGDKTKQVMFQDAIKANPNYLRDVDQFFRVAQRLQKQLNPSGTGGAMALAQHVAGAIRGTGMAAGAMIGNAEAGLAGSIIGSMVADAAGGLTAKLLRSPRFVSMLVEQSSPSFRALPVAQQAARATALANAFREASEGQTFSAPMR